MYKYLIVTPAYGRKYNTAVRTREAWNMGLDFKVWGGAYMSKRDMKNVFADGYVGVAIMYDSEKNPVYIETI